MLIFVCMPVCFDRGGNRSASGSVANSRKNSALDRSRATRSHTGGCRIVLRYSLHFHLRLSCASLDLARVSLFRGLLKNQSIVSILSISMHEFQNRARHCFTFLLNLFFSAPANLLTFADPTTIYETLGVHTSQFKRILKIWNGENRYHYNILV